MTAVQSPRCIEIVGGGGVIRIIVMQIYRYSDSAHKSNCKKITVEFTKVKKSS